MQRSSFEIHKHDKAAGHRVGRRVAVIDFVWCFSNLYLSHYEKETQGWGRNRFLHPTSKEHARVTASQRGRESPRPDGSDPTYSILETADRVLLGTLRDNTELNHSLFLQEPCDPIQNPSGFIALCTAENKLVTNMLAERCMHIGIDSLSDSSVYCYNSFLGMPLAREAAAYCLARRFLQPDNPDLNPSEALQLVQPKHVALGAGAAPILSNLSYMLGEAGDVCLIPAPYYAAFETDIHVVAGLLPFPIRQANPMQGPTESELDLAFLQARSKGLNPKILLLTNPNNPLAVIYRPAVLLQAVQWARKRKLHTIVDELYALSTHEVS